MKVEEEIELASYSLFPLAIRVLYNLDKINYSYPLVSILAGFV